MKKILTVVTLLTALCCAAGEYVTRTFGTSGVSVTNAQQNASWNLSAVAIKFGDILPLSTETVRVTRVSQGMEVVLGSSQQFGTSMVLALPEELTFKFGDVVKVYGGGATGAVQVFTTVK
jgi:2-phospho-L-lactate guanylyltransferase (CobY/MobA/RfbA family)